MDLEDQAPEQQDDRQRTMLRLAAANSLPKPRDAAAVARLLHHAQAVANMAPEVEIVNSSFSRLWLYLKAWPAQATPAWKHWKSAIKTANQTGAPTAAPAPEARGSPARLSLVYHAP